ncbi:hypothetical protein [Kordiimonas sp.]|uniref:hypothetical protein n=1 Tax=Kordiimonas sp. TaxID=1970157 RepID=UPI003A8F7516
MTQTSLLTGPAVQAAHTVAPPTATRCPRPAMQQPNIGFLFNHEQGHQLAHSAPILAALATREDQLAQLHAFVSSPARQRELKALIPAPAWRNITVHNIAPPTTARWAEALTGGAVPLQRIGSLVKHRALLKSMDVLVAPETTCTLLKTHLGCHNTRFVYTQHGAGDRAVGFKKIIARFDHVLVPGHKIRNRMLAAGIVREHGYSVVGYPKFDALSPSAGRSTFPNDNPTVLYNPHFHPALSSWYRDGLKVLEFFADNPQFNLIFAPHVMLFTRRVHASCSPPRLRFSGTIPARFLRCDNILVDPGSQRSMDMTYTRAADIYLGDASSQVYEFLTRPKPCLFLRSHGVSWADDPNYAHWHLGKVLDSPDGLGAALKNLSWFDDTLRTRQRRAFRATFGEAPFGASDRAANVIITLAAGRHRATVPFLPSQTSYAGHAQPGYPKPGRSKPGRSKPRRSKQGDYHA